MSRLELSGLTAGYGPTAVLGGVDLVVPAAGAVAILGANGAGKTTVLKAISGLIPSGGTILFDGAPLRHLATDAIARRGIAHVPEGRGTFLGLTVEENLRLGAPAKATRAAIAAQLDAVYQLFPLLTLRRRQRGGTLSGGEQQMLAIGRAVMQRPTLMLLDEPTFGLAPKVVEALLVALATLRATEGLSILVVEQNPAVLDGIVDSICVLTGGRIGWSGPPRDLHLFTSADDLRLRPVESGGAVPPLR